VWVRGHVVRGFIGGLIAGIGIALLFQQLDVWVLNTGTAIVLPVGLAILFAARAWMGRPYRVLLGPPTAG